LRVDHCCGQDDVAHVGGAVAEAFDLARRGHVGAQLGLEQAQEELAQAHFRVVDVAQTQAGVGEHQAIGGLRQHAVRDERMSCARHPGGHAIEMMHAQGHVLILGGGP